MTKKRIINFHGLKIRIENEAGSVRKGVDHEGKPWQITMTYPYGEIINSTGVDGDEVDVFVGDNKSAKFVYVIHQTKKDGSGFDEDKCFLGFDNAMDAKQAFYKNYDIPDFFYSDVETIPLSVFKKKVLGTKTNPTLIHASKMNTAISLYAEGTSSGGAGIGEPVTVSGFHGRGVVVRKDGKRITIRFRNGMYITRDARDVFPMSANTVSQMWRH